MVATPSLIGVEAKLAVTIIISFMSYLYDLGRRGSKLKSVISRVKQCMVFKGYPSEHFSHPRCSQALKASRYTTEEVLQLKEYLAEHGQLPLTLDMIMSIKEKYWKDDGLCLDKQMRYNRGVFLCLLLGYDTGKRIGNLTHRTSRAKEDHCVRTQHVRFHFSQSTHYEGEPIVVAGPDLIDFMTKHHPPSACVTKMTILFHTQKSTGIYQVTPTKSESFGRSTEIESWFLDNMLFWCLQNKNEPEDELFTRRIRNGTRKKLLAKDVTAAIKEAASVNGFDPKRFGSHSMRRGFVTIMYIHEERAKQIHPTPEAISALGRGGWVNGSMCPYVNYSRAELHGALSIDSTLFTMKEIRELL
jgi:hypothetical protein